MRSRTRRAPTPTPVGEAPDSVSEFTIHLGLTPPDNIRSGNDDKVEAGSNRRREATEALAQQPTGPVAGDRASDLPANGKAQSVLGTLIRQGDHDEEPTTESSSLLEDAIELRACPQPPCAPETPFHGPGGSNNIRQPAASGLSADAA
jgi:hypothetical protein